MTSLMHGRLHINNLPWEWTWKDVRQFVGERGIPKPNFIKQFWGEDACSSAFLHYYPISMGQLETFAEHLTGHALLSKKPHKRTVCQPALDLFGKRNAPTRSNCEEPSAPKRPKMYSRLQSWAEAMQESCVSEVTWIQLFFILCVMLKMTACGL